MINNKIKKLRQNKKMKKIINFIFKYNFKLIKYIFYNIV